MQFPNKKEAGKDEARQQKAKGNDVNSFCAKMLAESGLTFEDVTANVYKQEKTNLYSNYALFVQEHSQKMEP